MYTDIYCKNLKDILIGRELKNSDLSRMTGISNSFLSDITHGKANPSLRMMEQIANALQLPLECFLVKNPPIRIPSGYRWESALLTKYQAYRVRLEHAESMRKFNITWRGGGF